MSKLHFLNVGPGDCIILEHASGRSTMFDVCGGNLEPEPPLAKALQELRIATAAGNFRRCEHPSNPLDFLDEAGVEAVFRFILSHPDCDHLDGFDALLDSRPVRNFWHTGIKREKPHFGGSPFREEDWDRYEKVRDGEEDGTTSLMKRAGDQFPYANHGEGGVGSGDGLHILAPDNGLVENAHLTEDYNDGSFVILYRSLGGRVLLCGDAHDATWEYVLAEYAADVAEVGLMIAPHHGRDSGADFSFLDTVRPKLTLFGCAPSDDLAYDAWSSRDLRVITNNQAGSVTVHLDGGIMSVFVENERFAAACGVDTSVRNAMGFVSLGSFHG